ncbi:MAG: PQQ-binding-like beta-propeller repeat protein [Alphaproteobacteria bacterium]|nr:PQQ-binding-like beta-propeller repeat protein [Alphaproteobacteria bacterium]
MPPSGGKPPRRGGQVPMRAPDAALALRRRAALVAPLALAGCGLFKDWFGSNKVPLPGKREDVIAGGQGLQPSNPRRAVALPPAVANPDWPEPGGNPTHAMGQLQTAPVLNQAWRVAIGEGGGFRRKITAQPVVAGGRVYAMDSDAVVSAFDLRNGARRWRVVTRAKKDRSSNIGGGLAIEGGTVFVTTGRGDVLALDAGTGVTRWRQQLGVPARSSPTIAEGRLFFVTIEQQILALAAGDGARIWSHQASTAQTMVLGEPAPAYANGLVVAGFGSGDLLALRADSGGVAWTDSIAAVGGRGSMADISAISAMPVIADNRVFAIGEGGLMVGLDLPTGRRLWEHEVAGSQTPWIAGEWMFIVTLEGRTAAINAADGAVAWVGSLPRYKNPKEQKDLIAWFGPALASERLVFAGTNKRLVAVSPYDGRILGQRELPDNASVPPVVAGATLLIVTADGALTAYR